MKKLLYIWILFFTIFATVIHADITTGLVAHYKFENNVNDSTVNDNNGTIVPSTGNHVSYVNGVNGKAIFLNESAVNSDYIEIPLASKIWANGVSVCTWANFQGSGRSWERIFEFFGGTTNQRLTRDDISSNVSTDDVGILGTVDTGTFHHYCITYERTVTDTATKKAYRDGQYIGQATAVSLPSASVAWTTYRIGGSEQQGSDYNFYGYIDDFRVYERPLSGIDVTELYNIPKLSLKAHGGVVQFNGTNAVSLNPISNATVNNALTIEAWVNLSQNNSDWQHIVRQNGSLEWSLRFNTLTSELNFYIGGYGVVTVVVNLNDYIGKWRHITGVYDGSTVKIFVDGLQIGSSATTGTLPASPTITNTAIGASEPTGSFGLIGMTDEVRVWNIARTEAEINASMKHQLHGNETGLVAYYNFDERIGTTVKDISGHANNAIMEGNVTRVNFLGDGLSFSGTNSGIQTTASLNCTTYPNFSLGAWIKPTGSQTDWRAIFTQAGSLGIDLYNGTLGSAALATNQWSHVARSQEGSTVRYYVNGNLALEAGSQTCSGDNTPIFIGTHSDLSGSFDGVIAEASIWTKALTQSEIQKLVYAMPNVNDTNLTGYWPLNEGGGSIAYDHSSVPHNGTITAATWADTAPTIYGNNIYTSTGITVLNKLVVENNTSIPTYSYNGGVPLTIADFNGTTGVFTYSSLIAATETLDINANDGGVTLNSLFKVTAYATTYLNINIPSLNLVDFNITSIRAYTPDSAIEDLYVYDYYGRGGSNSITYGADNNYSVPIYFPENNFTIEVNGTFNHYFPQPSSWYYNFNDGKLYPDINSTTDFKTEINATNNTFTINTSNREYYTFTGQLFENDNNVTGMWLNSNDIYLGHGTSIAQGDTSYSIMYSELGEHWISMLTDNNTNQEYYYNFETGDINSTYQSTPSTIDTTTVKSFDLNLSSAHFADYSNIPLADISYIWNEENSGTYGSVVPLALTQGTTFYLAEYGQMVKYTLDMNNLLLHRTSYPSGAFLTSDAITIVNDEINITSTNKSFKIDSVVLDYMSLSTVLDSLYTFANPASQGALIHYNSEGMYYSSVPSFNQTAANELLGITSSLNPKMAKLLNNGYTYVSLPSSKTLCDEAVQHTIESCDQDNTLQSVFFGINSHVERVFKFGREWMYWDNNATANPAYSMQKFSTINPLEGIMVKTSAETNVSLPFDENSTIVNDYTNLFPTGWTLMSNNNAQTVGEISDALIAEGKTLVYILLLRDNVWHVYPSSVAVSPTIPMDSNSSVNRYESYWVYFISNAN